MIEACLDLLFGCSHWHQSRPFTLNTSNRRTPGVDSGELCYTVCLHCGHEMPYSWREMRPLTRADKRRAARDLRHLPLC